MSGVDLRLAATSSLNAYQPAASDADAVAGGSPLSLGVDAGYSFVGEVQFVSSDPMATLPGALQLDGARHGVAVLARQVVLRTPGVQTVSAIDAASGRVLSTEQFTVATDVASAGRCVVTAAARARAGDALTVVVRAVDAAGQAAPTDLSGITLSSNDPQATLPSAGLTQPGLAVFDGVVLRQSGAVVLTTGEGGGSTTVQVTAAAMVRLELTRVDGLPVALWGTAGSGVPLPAGQSVTVLLAARDAYGNLADNLAGPVQLTSSDARAVLPAPVQFTAGEARVRAATVVLATAGPQSIGAVAVNGMRATLPDVQVVAGPASRLQLAVPPGAVVGQPLAGLTLAATDTFGNLAAGYVGATALSSDDVGASLPTAPSLVAGAPGPLPLGPATFSRPGPVRLRAETVPTVALSPVVMSFSVAPAAVDPSHVTLSGGGGSIPADGVSQAQLTLRVADASDYPIAGYSVQLSVDDGATLLPQPAAGSTSVATDAAGEVAITLSSAHAGSAHLTVTVGPALVRLATVSFVAGPSSATNSVLSVSPGTQVADGVQAIALRLTAADAQGNPVPGAAVRLRSSSGGDVLTPSSGVTDATGSLQATLQGIHAGPRLLTATLSGTTVAQAVTLVPGPVAAANTALIVSPQELAADGQQATTLTLMAADAQGNAVTGQPVTVGVSGSSNVLGVAQGQTDAHGLFVTTLASTVREVKHVSALIGAVTANATVTFTSGPAAIAHSTLSASPTALPADGTSTSTLTLTAHDAQGLPAAGQAVTVLPCAPGITVSPTSGVTDGLGQFTAAASSTRATTATLVLAVGDGQLATSVQWQAGAPVASASELTLSPPLQVADGSAVALATVRLGDRFGNAVPNVAVPVSSSGTGNVVQPLASTTDASGRLQAQVQSTVAEAKVVTAQVPAVGSAPSFTLRAGARFVAGLAAASHTAVTAVPGSATADGIAIVALTLRAADAQDNAVLASPVTWSVSGTGATLTPGAPVTDATGQASASLTATTVGSRTVTAQVPGATATVAVSFSAGNANGSTSTLVASPSSVIADNVATALLTVTALDASAQPLANVAVGLSASGTGNTFAAANGFTDTDGHYVTTLRTSHAEAKTVTANIGGATQTATVTFVPGPAAAGSSQLTVSPTSALADGSDSVGVQIQAADAQGNPTPGVAVTLAANGGGAAFTPASGVTAADGTFVTALTSTAAETKIVTATFAGQQLVASARFLAGPPVAAHSQLTLTGSPAAADGSASLALAVHLGDAQGNAVVNTTVTLASSGTGNAVTLLYPVAGTTDLAGNLQAALRSTVAETKVITATAAGLTLTANVAFTAGAAATNQSTLTAAPASVTADGSSTLTLTLSVHDAQGNAAANVPVALTASGGGTTLSPASATTAADGTLTATLAASTAGSKTVTASFAGTSVSASVNFTAGVPAVKPSTFTASPATATADGIARTLLTLTLRDSNNNPVPNQTVTLMASGSGNTLSLTAGTTAADGSLVTALASTVAEVKTVTAIFGGSSKTATATFVAGPGASATSALSVSPASLSADGVAVTTLTATVRDAQGNPAPGVTVTFASTGTSNTLTPAGGTTNASGVVTTTLASTVAEAKTVTASFNGTSATAAVTFVPGAAAVATSSVTVSPAGITANGTSPATLTAMLKDAQGNAVPSTSVTLSSSGSNNTFAAATGTTNAAGLYTTTLSSTTAESKTITATFGGSSVTGTATFVAGSAASATSSVTASPTSVLANNVATTTLTALVKDAQGNAVAGQTVTFSATGTGNAFGSTTATTNASGQAAVTLASGNAGTKTASAAFASMSVSTNVVFTAGAVTGGTSSFTISPNSLAADGNATAALSVYAGDAQGNPVAGQAVSLTSTGTGHTLSPSSGTTSSAGIFTATATSTVAQLKVLTATMGAVTLNGNATFNAGAAASSTSTLTPSPTSLVANGTTTTTLTLQVNDAQGNGVGGQAVTWASTGSGNTLSAASATTSASGAASFTLKSTVAESKTVTASFAGTSVTTSLSFVAGTPAAATTSVAASPSPVTADGVSQTTLTATVRDAQGNPVGGQAGTFASSGTGNTLSSGTATTGAAGTAAVTLASTKAESKTITATFGVAKTTTVTFAAGPATVANSSVVASPTSLTANGTATTTLTVTLADAQNNPVSGQAAALAVTGSSNTLSAQTGTTSAGGTWAATLKSTKAEAKTVTASFGSLSVTTPVTFVAGAMVAANSTLTASPTSPVADGSTVSTATLTAVDANGNAVSGQTASFTATGSANTVTPASATTSAAGVATATVASTVAEAKTLTATVGGVAKTAGVAFVAGAPVTANSTLTASPSSAPADGSSTIALTATFHDAQGNPTPGASVYLTSNGTGDVFAPSAGLTQASGAMLSSVRSYSAGSRTVTATSGSAVATVAVTLTAASAATGTPLFGNAPMLVTGSLPDAAAVADLDGDGNRDVIISNGTSANLQVFLGRGNGLFAAPVAYPSGSGTVSVLVLDVNRDGKLDLISANNSANNLKLFINSGTGTFGAPATFTVSGNPVGLRAADLNGDSYSDVVVGLFSSYGVSVLLGTAGGSLGSATFVSTGTTSSAIADVGLGDLDNDGKQDVVAMDFANGNLVWSLGQGNGTFGPWSTASYGTAGGPGGIALGNLDADAYLDVVVANPKAAQAAVFYGATGASFGTATNLATPAAWQSVVIGEVTGDSHPDIVGVSFVSSLVTTFPGTGSRSLSPYSSVYSAQTTYTGSSSGAIALGDLDGDGHNDAVVTPRLSAVAGVFLGGNGGFSALPVFAANSGDWVASMDLVDVNHDGKLDLFVANNTAVVALGNGMGGFGAGQQIGNQSVSRVCALVDMNTDGNLDVVMGGYPNTYGWAGVQISLGRGDGTFLNQAQYSGGGKALWAAVGDLDGDGAPDIVSADYTAPTMSVFLNKGNGTMNTSVSYATDASPTFVSLGDYNGDGKLDVAIAQSSNANANIFLNAGSGVYGGYSRVNIAGNLQGLKTADFDRDGKLDLLATSTTNGNAVLLRGNGDGTFAAATVVDSGLANSFAPTVADIDADGLLDVILTSVNDFTVHVCRGRGDGTFMSPLVFPAGISYPQRTAVGDVDGDGRVDILAASTMTTGNNTAVLRHLGYR